MISVKFIRRYTLRIFVHVQNFGGRQCTMIAYAQKVHQFLVRRLYTLECDSAFSLTDQINSLIQWNE